MTCPTPCEKCRGHFSAYCKVLECECACHTPTIKDQSFTGEVTIEREALGLPPLEQKPGTLSGETEMLAMQLHDALLRARAKHPWSGSRWKALAALVSECGELADSIVDNEGEDRILSEAIDVMVTAYRIAVQK